jgi:Flp pilus assembly protein TadD
VPAIRPLPALVVGVVVAVALIGMSSGSNSYRANQEIFRAVISYPRDADETILGAHAAVTLDPGRGDYWNFRGLGLQLRGQFALAAEDFAQATRLIPYQPAGWINLSRSRAFQARGGDFTGGGQAASIAAAKHVVELDPRISATHKNYAEISLTFGDVATAVTEARIALGLQRNDGQIDNVLANACVALPDREAARRALESAVTLKPASAVLWSALAQVHLNDGNRVAARAAALRAFQIDPSQPDANRILAETAP